MQEVAPSSSQPGTRGRPAAFRSVREQEPSPMHRHQSPSPMYRRGRVVAPVQAYSCTLATVGPHGPGRASAHQNRVAGFNRHLAGWLKLSNQRIHGTTRVRQSEAIFEDRGSMMTFPPVLPDPSWRFTTRLPSKGMAILGCVRLAVADLKLPAQADVSQRSPCSHNRNERGDCGPLLAGHFCCAARFWVA